MSRRFPGLAEKRRLMRVWHRVYTGRGPRAAVLRGLAEGARRPSSRVYTAGDPRAAVLRGLAEEAWRQSGQRMWYDMAVRLHARVQAAKTLIPNVDFYSAPLFYSIGIPVDLFTPVIAASRLAGGTANLLA